MSEIEEPARISLLNWAFQSLGPFYALMLPLSGLLCFVLAAVVVLRGRGPMSGVSLLLIVHIPLLIGVFAGFHGAIASFQVIAISASAPKPAEIASGVSMALIAPLAGMLAMLPGYAIAVIGALFRSQSTESKPAA